MLDLKKEECGNKVLSPTDVLKLMYPTEVLRLVYPTDVLRSMDPPTEVLRRVVSIVENIAGRRTRWKSRRKLSMK